MKYRIIYTINGKNFEAIADSIFEALEFIQAIVKAHPVPYKKTSDVLSEWMENLVNMQNGKLNSSANHLFKVEAVKEKQEDD